MFPGESSRLITVQAFSVVILQEFWFGYKTNLPVV